MNIICHVCIAMISQYLNQTVNISQISINSHHIENNFISKVITTTSWFGAKWRRHLHLLYLKTRERLKTHRYGTMFRFHGTISIKSTRERSPICKRTMVPMRHIWPLGTNTQPRYNVLHPRCNLYQESKREITRLVNHGTTDARLSYCYSGISNS